MTTTTVPPMIVFPVFEQDRTVAAVPAVADFFKEVDTYLQGVWDDQQAELEAARRVPAKAPVSPSNGVGECVGFVVPDYVIRRESGGNLHAVNPSSGAFGCTQIMPAWWSGRCAHLDKWTLAGQQACTRIIMDTQGPSAWAVTW